MKFVLMITALFFCASSCAQKPTWDSSFRFYYYDQKLSMFEIMPTQKNEWLWLGDSITDGGEWSELFPKQNTANRGISSDNTYGILNRLHEVIKRKPKKIFLLIGINDISKNIPDEVIIANYKKIVDSVKMQLPKTKLYLQSLLPTNNSFTNFKNHQNKTEHVLAVNNAVKNMCDGSKIIFVDLYYNFLNTDGKLDEKYTNDGLHLTGEGYKHWSSLLKVLTN